MTAVVSLLVMLSAELLADFEGVINSGLFYICVVCNRNLYKKK